jgi:3',5'-cyclic AMP phosphodiesterase CpdA
MRRLSRCIILALLPLIFSCTLDGWGWLWSSDVDDRYRENQTLAAVPDPAIAGDFSFIVISDTHVFSGEDTASVFAQLQTRLDPGPNGDKFVLVCGDVVQNGARADVEAFAAQSAVLGLPIHSVPGNHDLYNGGWANYRDVLGRSMYTFSAGPVRVIAIDSANGTLGALQRSRLDGILAARAEPYCVTFTHMEFLCDTITETQQWTDLTETYSLMRLLETSGVDIHFAGHTHRRLERRINGTAYCTVPDFRAAFVRVMVSSSGITYQYIQM